MSCTNTAHYRPFASTDPPYWTALTVACLFCWSSTAHQHIGLSVSLCWAAGTIDFKRQSVLATSVTKSKRK